MNGGDEKVSWHIFYVILWHFSLAYYSDINDNIENLTRLYCFIIRWKLLIAEWLIELFAQNENTANFVEKCQSQKCTWTRNSCWDSSRKFCYNFDKSLCWSFCKNSFGNFYKNPFRYFPRNFLGIEIAPQIIAGIPAKIFQINSTGTLLVVYPFSKKFSWILILGNIQLFTWGFFSGILSENFSQDSFRNLCLDYTRDFSGNPSTKLLKST